MEYPKKTHCILETVWLNCRYLKLGWQRSQLSVTLRFRVWNLVAQLIHGMPSDLPPLQGSQLCPSFWVYPVKSKLFWILSLFWNVGDLRTLGWAPWVLNKEVVIQREKKWEITSNFKMLQGLALLPKINTHSCFLSVLCGSQDLDCSVMLRRV